MSAELLKEKIKEILKGIDECEVYSDQGWWETSSGQKFGADKLKEILAAIDEHFQLEKEKSNQLKPCPFCKSHLVETEPGSNYFSHPGGMSCILDGFDMDADGNPELVAQWNRRAQPAEEVQRIAVVEDSRTDLLVKALKVAREPIADDCRSFPTYRKLMVLEQLDAALAAKDKP